jgi:iodotyrosine deiodinase
MNPKPAPCVLEPLPDYREYPQPEMVARARAFHADLVRRRTVRDFDTRPVPREVIESCLLAAGTAPSGANQQPWFFSVITNPEHKRRVREAAEAEERRWAPTGTSPSWKRRRC